MLKKFYEDNLYPLQDKVLHIIADCNTPLYLTGGTALSRFHLHHRYSDDLDFFINRDADFTQYIKLISNRITEKFLVKIAISDTDFARIHVFENETELKVEFINDVAFHYGEFTFPNGWKVDNALNILSNKLTALSRNAPKDFADILFLSLNFPFNWIEVFEAAKAKDAWINELYAVEIFDKFDINQLESVNWIEKFNIERYQSSFKTIAKDILLGSDNSIYGKD